MENDVVLCISIDNLDTKNDEISNSFKNCVKEIKNCSNTNYREIWITGHYSKFLDLAIENPLLSVKCIDLMVNHNIRFTDDATNILNTQITFNYLMDDAPIIHFEEQYSQIYELSKKLLKPNNGINNIEEFQNELLKFDWIKDNPKIENRVKNISNLLEINNQLEIIENSKKEIPIYKIIQSFDYYPDLEEDESKEIKGNEIVNFIEKEIFSKENLKDFDNEEFGEIYLDSLKQITKNVKKERER